ncbi:lipoate-protein ligase A [Halanaerobium saccharolyticum]|uniref:Lipoate-protein ligase A n=1 Tax=Halanaerobium saccharolyticum TaxID=43595 RepID=A0A4V3G5R9_9FIRM|nr:biotin/lipoate A/B protein ligase family protein [Halanaerobium saccharolyticum]RAK09321.1 lipoate-protein ligase A [Halanaerobium saccharolyticum]TDW06180.1 lipoate-protein ligase A [Halanaerobium saccharolyticum]TDX60974.1 lipoate-protein ligase A [Halanaerobium saccharolyticum]
METWRLLTNRSSNAFYNMAVDEAIMILHSKNKVPPTLRFYSWKPAALSLGYFQKAKEEINYPKCQEEEIDLVRRLTGGRAILHDQELTYSLIIREDFNLLADSIEKSYQQISSGLVRGLQQLLGIPAELKAVERGKKAPVGHSAACFDAPSWYEVILNNKKLIGSAQRRKDGTILQHGSLPLAINAEKIFKLLNYSSEQQRKKASRIFTLKSTSLRKAGYNFSHSELENAIAAGLSQSLGIELTEGKLTAAEIKLAQKLVLEKYQTQDWNFKR